MSDRALEREAFPGELAALRTLARLVRDVVNSGSSAEAQRAQVQRLLAQHDADRAEITAAGSSGPSGRVAALLEAIRAGRGRWTTATAYRFYRGHLPALAHIPNTQLRAMARGDLRDLAAGGHLVRHEEPGRVFFVLRTAKNGEAQ